MANAVPPVDDRRGEARDEDAAGLTRPRVRSSDRPASTRIAELIAYYGPARLAAWVVAAGAVLAVGWWMMRPATPTTESLLPDITTLPGTTVPATAPVTVSDAPLVVHVAGAVRVAGVYEIPVGGRVHDAIEAAGGPAADADLDRVNLAAALSDGARVHVPAIGEPDPPPLDPSMEDAGDDTSPPSPVDVNRGGLADLEQLPGVGPSIAAAIVEEREQGGPFASVEDLQRVPGIGPVRLEAIRDLVAL